MPSYGLGRTSSAFDFKLPSGETCLMKHADLEALIASGVVDSIDQLTSLVKTDHVDRVKKGKKNRHVQLPPGANGLQDLNVEARATLELMKDKNRWSTIQDVVNAVVVQCVMEPRVFPAPPEGQERPPHENTAIMAGTAFAVQDVSLMDRLAIFSEAMRPIMAGQAAVKPFRDGREETLADVADVEDVQPAAERNAGGA